MKVTVYTTNYCGYCVRAKELLKRRGIPFTEIHFGDADETRWNELELRSGMKTMPQIFADEKLIGGYHELAALDSRDQLASLK